MIKSEVVALMETSCLPAVECWSTDHEQQFPSTIFDHFGSCPLSGQNMCRHFPQTCCPVEQNNYVVEISKKL